MAWLPTYPTSRSRVKDIPTYLQDNWSAIQTGQGVEHYSLSSASSGMSGMHSQGTFGGIYRGTTTEIAALSSPNSGALAYDTTLGVLFRYSGTAWQRIHINTSGTEYWSSVRAYLNTKTAMPSGGYTAVVFDTEVYDLLGEYDNATGYFRPKENGWYLVAWAIACSGATGIVPITVSGKVDGDIGFSYNSATYIMDWLLHHKAVNNAYYQTIGTCGIFRLDNTGIYGDDLWISVTKESTEPKVDMMNGADLTYLCIHRVAFSCV